ncbi:unnamed protein product (macronuclear) [Paramecium tetraurelia]|uniref:TLDc domain-containing protein n=1 Tax=Paramecium tetraurelia TaxID=5888 RepID=A0CNX2_PARTE|nr:uncharacterized protein GSPATT00038758001 [Paramecium tetraurelia]CAK72489.1 unnamed protein product [Paramecium tetraurelia]|eukprot:XP_001439886.1 hypothetical protein (macronuclear) [Paramecium tetraurelia strain d4-2]
MGNDNTQYICDECCLDLQDGTYKVNVENLIHIKDVQFRTILQKALKGPEHLISKLNLSPSLKNFFNELDKFNDKTLDGIFLNIKTQIVKIQNFLFEVQSEMVQDSKYILDTKQKIREQLNKIIKFDQFQQILQNFQSIEVQNNVEAIQQNERIVHNYLIDLTKNDSKELNQTLTDLLNGTVLQLKNSNQEKLPQCKKLQEQFRYLNASKQELIKQINVIYFEQSILSYYYKQKIINTIQLKSDKIATSFQRIFLSSKDGLNASAFWGKVEGKSNLLMIFKTKSGYIFGGFSPCQWLSDQNNYVKDGTLTSFIFSQSYDEVYPLKSLYQSKAIYSGSNYGPTFGDGHDIYIDQDFQNGYSNLGYAYKWDKYQNAKSSYLFGQSTPNISECEIYQVIFG